MLARPTAPHYVFTPGAKCLHQPGLGRPRPVRSGRQFVVCCARDRRQVEEFGRGIVGWPSSPDQLQSPVRTPGGSRLTAILQALRGMQIALRRRRPRLHFDFTYRTVHAGVNAGPSLWQRSRASQDKMVGAMSMSNHSFAADGLVCPRHLEQIEALPHRTGCSCCLQD